MFDWMGVYTKFYGVPETEPETDNFAETLIETDLSSLNEVNEDVFGWITIPDTTVSDKVKKSPVPTDSTLPIRAIFIQSSRLYSVTAFRYFSGSPFSTSSAYSSGAL